MKTKLIRQRLACTIGLGLLLAGVTNQAQAAYAPGQPLNGLVGLDNPGAGVINLDELGNISGSFTGFFGPYDVTLSHIASTVNPAWVDNAGVRLEVTSYLVRGKGGFAAIQLAAGTVGILEPASDGGQVGVNDLSDALIFTPLGIDSAGYGLTRIDFLSDNESVWTMATDRLVTEDATAHASYEAFDGSANGERMTFHIDSSAPDSASVPDTGTTFGLFSLALTGLGLLRRKLA